MGLKDMDNLGPNTPLLGIYPQGNQHSHTLKCPCKVVPSSVTDNSKNFKETVHLAIGREWTILQLSGGSRQEIHRPCPHGASDTAH